MPAATAGTEPVATATSNPRMELPVGGLADEDIRNRIGDGQTIVKSYVQLTSRKIVVNQLPNVI
jgi:hypothetical protein